MTRTAYQRSARLERWPGAATWGYDASLEAYWARLAPGTGADAGLEIGSGHLVASLPGLARVLADAIGAEADEVFLALTAPVPARSAEAGTADLT